MCERERNWAGGKSAALRACGSGQEEQRAGAGTSSGTAPGNVAASRRLRLGGGPKWRKCSTGGTTVLTQPFPGVAVQTGTKTSLLSP